MRLMKTTAFFLLFILLPLTTQAESKTFVESYTYQAGEADSKLTCRTLSLIQVKRLLLEKIGTYIQSRTAVRNFEITKDEIVSLTAGIVKTEILDEAWNGRTYQLTARIEANPEAVADSLENLKKQQMDNGGIPMLEDINSESLEKLREMQSRMEQLQSNLLKVNQDMSANKGLLTAWGMYEKGVKLRQAGEPEEAVKALTNAVAYNPTPLVYLQRAEAYMELKLHKLAISDFTQALNMEPNMRGALWGRGQAYIQIGNKRKGRKDILRAAELGNGRAKKWLHKHNRKK